MTRKIDPDKEDRPSEIDDVTSKKASSRPPHDWPGIEGRSEEDEAEFVHGDKVEEPADVTNAQRDLERRNHRREPPRE